MKQITPLQEFSVIENELHQIYGEHPPTEKQIQDYFEKRNLPINDGGLIIGIISLIITAWAAGRQEAINKKNKLAQQLSEPPRPKCPVEKCRLSASSFDFNTQEYSCDNGHTWK